MVGVTARLESRLLRERPAGWTLQYDPLFGTLNRDHVIAGLNPGPFPYNPKFG
jgi:hypothetical protein